MLGAVEQTLMAMVANGEDYVTGGVDGYGAAGAIGTVGSLMTATGFNGVGLLSAVTHRGVDCLAFAVCCALAVAGGGAKSFPPVFFSRGVLALEPHWVTL